jgi:hypothetical protein
VVPDGARVRVEYGRDPDVAFVDRGGGSGRDESRESREGGGEHGELHDGEVVKRGGRERRVVSGDREPMVRGSIMPRVLYASARESGSRDGSWTGSGGPNDVKVRGQPIGRVRVGDRSFPFPTLSSPVARPVTMFAGSAACRRQTETRLSQSARACRESSTVRTHRNPSTAWHARMYIHTALSVHLSYSSLLHPTPLCDCMRITPAIR